MPGPGRHPYFSAGIASASVMICRPAILNSGAHPEPASVIESCATASPAIALIVSKKVVDRILHAILSLVSCHAALPEPCEYLRERQNREFRPRSPKRRWHGGPSLTTVSDELNLSPVGHLKAIQMSEKSATVRLAFDRSKVSNTS